MTLISFIAVQQSIRPVASLKSRAIVCSVGNRPFGCCQRARNMQAADRTALSGTDAAALVDQITTDRLLVDRNAHNNQSVDTHLLAYALVHAAVTGDSARLGLPAPMPRVVMFIDYRSAPLMLMHASTVSAVRTLLCTGAHEVVRRGVQSFAERLEPDMHVLLALTESLSCGVGEATWILRTIRTCGEVVHETPLCITSATPCAHTACALLQKPLIDVDMDAICASLAACSCVCALPEQLAQPTQPNKSELPSVATPPLPAACASCFSLARRLDIKEAKLRQLSRAPANAERCTATVPAAADSSSILDSMRTLNTMLSARLRSAETECRQLQLSMTDAIETRDVKLLAKTNELATLTARFRQDRTGRRATDDALRTARCKSESLEAEVALLKQRHDALAVRFSRTSCQLAAVQAQQHSLVEVNQQLETHIQQLQDTQCTQLSSARSARAARCWRLVRLWCFRWLRERQLCCRFVRAAGSPERRLASTDLQCGNMRLLLAVLAAPKPRACDPEHRHASAQPVRHCESAGRADASTEKIIENTHECVTFLAELARTAVIYKQRAERLHYTARAASRSAASDAHS